jgi:fructokinase
MKAHPRILVIGEALMDEFGDAVVAGGAPFNLARHLSSLGVTTDFVSRVGADAYGARLLREAEISGLDVGNIQTDAYRASGSVRVSVDAGGQPSYTIAEPVAWDQIESFTTEQSASVVACGSLALRSSVSRASIFSALEKRSSVKCFVDINLRQTGPSADVLAQLLHRADWLKLNDAELTELADWLHLPSQTASFVQALQSQYGVSVVVLTRGAQGCQVFERGGPCASVAGTPVTQMADAVGAGDAFSAAWLAAFTGGLPAAQAARFANAYAATVCTFRGPMPPHEQRADHFANWRRELTHALESTEHERSMPA